ncbi:unnamed protein product [Caenorhabditis auriculariae]|uniref:Uncharacterized protein n=1 Tax=Caenorhabditis auriculariae TaxID=2777116 RepID=A0A8S1HMS8_9PELO|nr:unnamed protein product [Caenorhabditis auriculariae]
MSTQTPERPMQVERTVDVRLVDAITWWSSSKQGVLYAANARRLEILLKKLPIVSYHHDLANLELGPDEIAVNKEGLTPENLTNKKEMAAMILRPYGNLENFLKAKYNVALIYVNSPLLVTERSRPFSIEEFSVKLKAAPINYFFPVVTEEVKAEPESDFVML